MDLTEKANGEVRTCWNFGKFSAVRGITSLKQRRSHEYAFCCLLDNDGSRIWVWVEAKSWPPRRETSDAAPRRRLTTSRKDIQSPQARLWAKASAGPARQ